MGIGDIIDWNWIIAWILVNNPQEWISCVTAAFDLSPSQTSRLASLGKTNKCPWTLAPDIACTIISYVHLRCVGCLFPSLIHHWLGLCCLFAYRQLSFFSMMNPSSFSGSTQPSMNSSTSRASLSRFAFADGTTLEQFKKRWLCRAEVVTLLWRFLGGSGRDSWPYAANAA